MKLFFSTALLLGFAAISSAQNQAPIQATAGTATATTTVADVRPLISRIEQETEGLSADLSRLRIDKWKADSATKQQASENEASIQRNIHAALPELLSNVQKAPQSLAASFKLYRNLNALYDVVSSLAESTGAFGKREEYESIGPHVAALDDLRRTYADDLQQMATSADDRIAVAEQQARAAAAAAAEKPPKKIIVDETESIPAPKKRKSHKSSASSSAKTSNPQ